MPTALKNVSVRLGFYRPARWLIRHMRSNDLRRHLTDVSFYRALLRPDALAFDVGANNGEKSEALLKANARVVAFEPNPAIVPELRARCEHHPRWTLVQAGIGAAPGILMLHDREQKGSTSFHPAGDWEGRVVQRYNVPVVTLDMAIDCFGTPDYCKIDVEGWELEVLRGLTRPVPLLSFECHLNIPKDVEKTRACLGMLAESGMSEANFVHAETSIFRFPTWIPLPSLIERFPGILEEGLSWPLYGDIYVRR